MRNRLLHSTKISSYFTYPKFGARLSPCHWRMQGLWISWQTRFLRAWHSCGLSGHKKAEKGRGEGGKMRARLEVGQGWRETCAWVLAGLLVCFEADVLVTLRSTGVPSLPPYSLDKNESKSHFISCVSLLQIPRELTYFGHTCLGALLLFSLSAQMWHSSSLWRFTKNGFSQALVI